MDSWDISNDNLSGFAENTFVTFGETMIREPPADLQRPEATRQVHISLAGSEFSIAVLLARLGIPSAYVTRVPDNPYGWMLRDTARANGVDVKHLVWAQRAEPIGRYIYEMGRSPRAGVVWYQRMHSAASRLGAGMVDWRSALANCRLLHTSGITFGLAAHSGYATNPLLDTFQEALAAKPSNCLVGMDFNYRSTLWTEEECRDTITPLISQSVDVLITSVQDMAYHYGIDCGRYSAAEVNAGQTGDLSDDDLRAFGRAVTQRFNLRVVAVTLRQSDTSEVHRWEAAAMGRDGSFFRSPVAREVVLADRIGGGDAWAGGFYYGLLTAGVGAEGLEKGVLVGDATTRLKQTLMFDLPLITRAEVQTLLKAEALGSSTRFTVR
ncbi:MAG: sugar kinase [Anaerolineae bacterium]|nr:sugar kinase [Anaerolineae bacterium]